MLVGSNRRSQRGDTIVEVMVALAILALAFAISYATASHSLQVSRNSQEHSQALQLLNSQVELVRAKASDPDIYEHNPAPWFCASTAGSDNHIVISKYSVNDTSDPNHVPSACKLYLNGQIHYTVYTSYDQADNSNSISQDIFTFTITWPGIGDLGPQQEQIAYKLHDLSGYAGDSIGDGEISAPTCPSGTTGTWPNCSGSIRVVVKSIAPNTGNTTPSCSTAATRIVGGTDVRLTGPGGYAKVQSTNNFSSATTFTGLTGGGTYTATGTSAPSEYELCPPATGSQTAASGGIAEINSIKIRPICKAVWQQIGTTEEWGVTGYQTIYYQYWGVTGYQTIYYQYWGVTGYQTIYYQYWGVTGYGWLWNGSYWYYGPTYGWVWASYQQPVYGWLWASYQQPVYGWLWASYQQPVYGWKQVPVYGYVNKCPPY